MSYFKNFPQILYSFETGQKVSAFLITDILRRVKADQNNITNITSYDEYDIKEGETPEILAHLLYGDSTLHWVILIVNEFIDPRFDWPLSTQSFEAYVTNKYGAGNEYAVHHYVTNDAYMDTVHSTYAGAKLPITNYDWEYAVNESKRRIKILKPEFVAQFVQAFTGQLNNG